MLLVYLSVSQVFMGKLQADLGLVQYDSDLLLSPIPLAAQISLGAGAAVIILSVLIVILMYRYNPLLLCPWFLQSRLIGSADRRSALFSTGGRVNRLSEIIRRFCCSWKLWR